MTENSETENFDVVMENPAIYYSHPADIVTDNRLTNAERLRLLGEWSMDISNKLSADEEGMIPPHARDSANDAVIMEHIASARTQLQSLDSANDGFISAVKRMWQRL